MNLSKTSNEIKEINKQNKFRRIWYLITKRRLQNKLKRNNTLFYNTNKEMFDSVYDRDKISQNKNCTIKTRGGHEIFFDDKDLNYGLEIRTRSGHLIKFESSSYNEPENILIEKNESKRHKSSIHLDSAGQISIMDAPTLKIKAENIEIEATDKMKLVSGSTMTINGPVVKIN